MGDLGGGSRNGARNPDPLTISEEIWSKAEEGVHEVLNCIHPTLDSEEKRKDVIDYVQRLIKCSLGYEVFPYGSVPLKTYLPDGDIDLTALTSPCFEESWASAVLSVLKGEEQNENAEYEVKDAHFIDAEVKLIKCLVENIVIDISCNQLGGLCTLCFLEQVDRLVGKNHLFKRSIILIKAWCYYESRILGAYHGLLSTYALETLVLYIFHLFHSSLNSPLAVLYRFLDYFSRFDWEKYCISLRGPVYKSALPDIVVEMPKDLGNDLMLSEEFLRNAVEMFVVPSGDSDSKSRAFPLKHLNIIDPLKGYNNLGRSVHRGNFFRIRSAFKYGTRKLGKILALPIEDIADEIKNFFPNTLQRHLYKDQCDNEVYSPFSVEGSGTLYSVYSAEGFSEDDTLQRSSTCDFVNEGFEAEQKSPSVESGRSFRQASSPMMSELGYSMNGSAISGTCNGASSDIAASRSMNFRGLNCRPVCSSVGNRSNSLPGQYQYAQQCYYYEPSAENGNFYRTGQSDGLEEKLEHNPWLEFGDNRSYEVDTYQQGADYWDGYGSGSSVVSSPKTSILESLSLGFREKDAGSVVDIEPLNPLADLTGDYDSHIRSILYWQCCHRLAQFAPVVSTNPALPSQFVRKKACGTVHQSVSDGSSSCSSENSSTISMELPAHSSSPTSVSASEEKHTIRGIGTYIPGKNSSGRDGPSQGSAGYRPSGSNVQVQADTRDNGYIPGLIHTNSSQKFIPRWEGSNGRLPSQSYKNSGVTSPCNHSNGGDARARGSFFNASCGIEFGSLGSRRDEAGSSSANGQVAPISQPERGESASGANTRKERDADQSFSLKNDEEFPALRSL